MQHTRCCVRSRSEAPSWRLGVRAHIVTSGGFQLGLVAGGFGGMLPNRVPSQRQLSDQQAAKVLANVMCQQGVETTRRRAAA